MNRCFIFSYNVPRIVEMLIWKGVNCSMAKDKLYDCIT